MLSAFRIVTVVKTVYTTRALVEIIETIVTFVHWMLSESSSGDGRTGSRSDLRRPSAFCYFLGQCQKVNKEKTSTKENNSHQLPVKKTKAASDDSFLPIKNLNFSFTNVQVDLLHLK